MKIMHFTKHVFYESNNDKGSKRSKVEILLVTCQNAKNIAKVDAFLLWIMKLLKLD